MSQVIYVYINPFAPGDFAEKRVLKLVVLVILLSSQQASFWWEAFLGKLLRSQDQVNGKEGEQQKKIFMDILSAMSHGCFLLTPVSLTELCSFQYGLKDLFTLHKLVNRVVLEKGRGSARVVTGSSGANGLIKKPKNDLLPTFLPDFT